jgi:hypothetical protein
MVALSVNLIASYIVGKCKSELNPTPRKGRMGEIEDEA